MKTRAFSLLELLVVMALMAVLSLLSLPQLTHAQNKGKETAQKANTHTLILAIESYAMDQGFYPQGKLNIAELIQILSAEKYLKGNLRNPFTGKNYADGDSSGKIIYEGVASGYHLECFGLSEQQILYQTDG